MGFELELATRSVSPLPEGEVGSHSDPGEGLRPIDRPYPLTPALSPRERGRIRCRGSGYLFNDKGSAV